MHPMATGAIGRHGRAVLRRQPVVAVEKGPHPVRREVVLGVQPLRGVAVAAHLGRRTALEGGDLVLGMAIRACGRVPVARRHRLAMDTGLDVLGYLVVARPARLGQPREMKRGFRGVRGQDIMLPMAIAARRRPRLSLGQGHAMNARPVALRLLAMARGAVHPAHRHVVIGMFGAHAGMASHAGVCPVDGPCEPGGIHKEGDLLPGRIRLGQRLVRVAFQAGAVLDGLPARRCQDLPNKDKNQCC